MSAPTQTVALATDATIGVAFGLALSTANDKLPVGLLCAMSDELRRRGCLADITAALGLEASRMAALRVAVDRNKSKRARSRSDV